jgi:predicted enzyme related to lactoylglutathione lyase
MIKGISVVYLHSTQGERLSAWYSEVLGLSLRTSMAGWTEFQMPQGPRFAVDHVDGPCSAVERQAVMISFEVDDIRSAVAELSGRGVRFYPFPEETIFDVGPSLVATFEDPDGNWAQLNQVKASP